MNLLILTESDSIDKNNYIIKDHRADHVKNILSLKVGDSLEVGLLNGPIGKAIIKSIDVDKIILECEFQKEIKIISPVIDLICALPRPQTLKKVLFTSASMGIRRIHLIRSNRVEKSYFHSPLLKPENYERFLIEGLSQGKLTHMPEVHIHHYFKKYFQDILSDFEKKENSESLRLLPSLDTKKILNDIYNKLSNRILLAIGPEGGWVPFEIELMKDLGFMEFRLGSWVLRVETALAAVLSQIELVKNLSLCPDFSKTFNI